MLFRSLAGVAVLTPDHILFQLQLLIAASCIFVVCLPLLRPKAGFTLDADWFWRELPRKLAAALSRALRPLRDAGDGLRDQIHGNWGPFSRGAVARWSEAGNWPTGQIAFWATALLASYVLIAAL